MSQTIERAAAFYAAVLVERKGKPEVLLARTLLLRMFNQRGLDMVNDLEGQQKAGTLTLESQPTPKKAKPQTTSEPAYAEGYGPATAVQRPQKPALRPFNHPAQGLGAPTGPLGGKPANFTRPPRKRMTWAEDNAGDEGHEDEAEEDIKVPSMPTAAAPAPAAGDGDGDTGADAQEPFTVTEQAEIAEMQATGVMEKYPEARIRAYLTAEAVPYRDTATHRQLSANLIGHVKSKLLGKA